MRKLIIKTQKPILLSKYVLSNYKSLKSSSFFKALRNKDIRINDVKTSKDILVKNGDILNIYINDNILFNLPNNILYAYEDENILAAYKPQGILSNFEESSLNNDEPCFLDLIKKDLNNENIKICHRLDRNTAGLIIFSKNEIAHNEILKGFKEGYIFKEYIAYVSNFKFDKPKDILTAYMIKDSSTSYSKIYDVKKTNSVKIITEYEVLQTNKDLNYAKLNIKLHTGKTHQIRAHLSHINHPVIGDSKYGINDVNKFFNVFKQLLFSYKYTFNFSKDSIFYYLNKTIITTEVPEYIFNIRKT